MNYVVTACDTNGWNMLIPFIASLFDIAKWSGPTLIMDLGLTQEQIKLLNENQIQVISNSKTLQSQVCQRFDTLADFATRHKGKFAHWDADIWFLDNINELFENSGDKLICTIDRNRQGFVSGVVADKTQASKVDSLLDSVVEKYTKLLQVGFIFGNEETIIEFANVQRLIIQCGLAADTYGTDTLALNLFAKLLPNHLQVSDIRYNCIPDWQPIWKNKSAYVDMIQIKAIHQTSPYRNNAIYSYKTYYPESYNNWCKKLGFSTKTQKYERVNVRGIDFIIRSQPYWDHTILYHAIDNYSLPEQILPGSNILDIGAHIGGFTKRVASTYKHANVFAFEPDKDNFQLLLQNLDSYQNVKLYNYGVSGHNMNGSLLKPCEENTGMHRVIPGDGEIQLRSINSIIEEIGNIFCMKIDCEGSEWSILNEISQANLQKIKQIQGEIHPDLYPFNEVIDMTTFLKQKLYNYQVTLKNNHLVAWR